MLLAVVERPPFVQFFRIHRERRGFASWRAFAGKADVGEASVYRVLDEGPGGAGTHLNTRNQVARALGFEEGWASLVRAYTLWLEEQSSPVGPAPGRLSEDAAAQSLLAKLELLAEAYALTPEEYVDRQLRGLRLAPATPEMVRRGGLGASGHEGGSPGG